MTPQQKRVNYMWVGVALAVCDVLTGLAVTLIASWRHEDVPHGVLYVLGALLFFCGLLIDRRTFIEVFRIERGDKSRGPATPGDGPA